MPSVTKSISSFTLKSSWKYRTSERSGSYYSNPSTPSTATKTVAVDLSDIPSGSRVTAATLKITTAQSTSTAKANGKSFTVNGNHQSGVNVLSWFSSLGSSLSITFSFQYASPSDTWSYSSASMSCYFSSISLSITYELPASSGSTSVSSIDAGSGSVTLTINPANTSYTHKATWKIGDNVIKGPTNIPSGTTTDTCSLPLSVCNYITNATSATCTVVLETYNGTTLMGSNTYTFTVNVPSTVVPTAGGLSSSPVTTGAAASMADTYVQGYSKASLSLPSVAGAYGSTITSVVFSGWGATANGTASGSTYSATTPTLTMNGNVTMTAVVTDSRGRTVTETLTIKVEEYTSPVISSIVAKRCLQDGTLNDQGRYARVVVTFSIASVDGLNTATTKSYYKQSTSTTYTDANMPFTSGTAIIIGNGLIGTDASHNIKVTVADDIGNTATAITSIPTTTYVMHFRDGGLSVGIGRAAVEEDNIVAINDTWRLRAYSGLLQPHSVMVGAIPSGADLNSYTVAGEYSVESNTIAASLSNRPCDLTGKLIVGSAAKDEVGVTIAASTNCYMYQMYMAYDLSAIYMRRMYTGSTAGTASFTAWKQLAFTDDITAANFSGTLPIGKGGTGQTTAAGVRTALNVPKCIEVGDTLNIPGVNVPGWVTNSKKNFRASLFFGRPIRQANYVTITATACYVIGPGGKLIDGGNITGLGSMSSSIQNEAGIVNLSFTGSYSTTNNTPHVIDFGSGAKITFLYNG